MPTGIRLYLQAQGYAKIENYLVRRTKKKYLVRKKLEKLENLEKLEKLEKLESL